MAPSILIFDFGTNEDAAQQARHKVEAWKQGFRLGNKIAFKFEREEIAEGKGPQKTEAEADAEPEEKGEGGAKGESGIKAVAKAGKSGKKTAKKSAAREKGGKEPDDDESEEREEAESNGGGRVRVFVRLDFSDHEKLSHQRWLDRIPAEEPFKSADGQTVRANDAEFAKMEELFESLD
jgi:hypothetical protein